jgi:ketosteroid isomerase-like protein
MSHRNEQLLRHNYEAFGRGDLDTVVGSFADDITWEVSGRSPIAGVYSGKEQVLGFFGKMMSLYGGTLQVTPFDFLADDDHGVVLVRERGEYGGRSAEYEGVHRWDFRDGTLARFASYYDDNYHNFWSGS